MINWLKKNHWFHDWNKWDYTVTKEGRVLDCRQCKFCGKTQMKWIVD